MQRLEVKARLMNFQQLRIIRETLRHNFNLTDAANALLTSQSGVSKHIRDLEDELGFEIFLRRGKRLLGLTEPGKAVVGIVERILLETQNLEQLSAELSRSDAGTLTIATTHTQARYILPPVIAAFKQSYPNVRLTLKQANPKDIANFLHEGLADIGIATDTLDDAAGILSFPYLTWEHAVVVPDGHPLVERAPLSLAVLGEYPIVTYDEGLTGRARIDLAFAQQNIIPDITMTALDADVIKACVGMGLGVGVIASMAFEQARDTELVLLQSPGLFPASTSSIAVRHGHFLRDYVYRFIELCSPSLTEAIVRRAQERPPR